jgi:hypothetical protein
METGEIEDKKYRIKETDTKDFWTSILNDSTFTDYVKNKYSITTGDIMQKEEA